MRSASARHLLQKITSGGERAASGLGGSRNDLTLDGKDRTSGKPRTCVVASSRVTCESHRERRRRRGIGFPTRHEHTVPTGSVFVMPSKKSASSKGKRETSALVLTVDEIRQLLVVGRAAAYALARQLGRRIGGKKRGRLLVPRAAFERWLRESEGGAS